MLKKLQISILVFLSWNAGMGQHNVGFQIPSQVCIGQSINIQNTSDAGNADWNFCSSLNGSYSSSPKGTIAASLSGISIIEVNGLWFGFAVTHSNQLYRLDFGSNPNATYMVTSLGNPGGLFNSPDGIKIISSNGKWYGLVSNQNNNDIIRLVWTDLTQTPTASSLNMSSSGKLNAPAQIDIKVDGSNYVAVVANAGANQLTMINFGQSMDNNPSVSDMILSPVLSGSVNMYGVTVEKVCDQWAIYTSVSDKMYKINGGTQLFSAIDPSQIQDISADIPISIGSYVRLKSVVEGGDTYVYFTSYTSNVIAGFVWQAGATNATFKDLTNLSGPGQLYVLETYRYNNTNGFYIGSFGSGATNQVVVNYSCAANQSQSKNFSPLGVYYTLPGTYTISLALTFPDGTICSTNHQITVTSLQAPDISFSTQNICANSNVLFSSINQSGNISTYQWDFGDGSTDMVNANPSHIYSSASVYYPSLTVTASNGCQNFVQDTLQIYNVPQASFTLPTASPLCTNQNYLHTNTSTFDVGSNPTWQWSVNGSNVSTNKDLTYQFTSSTTQSIMLTASIPGCSTQSTQNITTLVDGPLISFSSSSGACQSVVIPFTNTTADPVTSFTWSFGDGNSSSQVNSSNAYSSAGNYVVSLSGINSNGCENSYTKNITIYSLPQPNFVIEAPPLSCEKTPSQFDNLTPALVDSNISSWAWKFGDAASGSSSAKNPTYTYATANNYTVSLRATTNVGCKDSIQKSITILPSPQAGFTNSAACINQSTHFTDASTGSISFYQWNVQNVVLSGATPSYVFKSSGGFPVTLTVTGSNGCLNQSQKTIQVPVMPIVDFSIQAPCTGHPTVFQEINSGGSDPAVAWNWDFGQSSATGSPVSYQFPLEGGYSVTMTTTRQSGCIYSAQKNIAITAGPVASFTPSVFAGAAPLDVIFNNTSTADSYFWQFGDAVPTTSTLASPEFVYTQLGKYKVLLTAFNAIGCSDTLSTEIDVVVPHIDIVMNNLSLTNDPNTNSSKAIVTILNSGNIPLADPEVLIDFGGSASVKEKISGLVRPGKTIVQTLGLQIVPRTLDYICAEVNVADDADIHNNKQCVPLSSEDVVLAPYPNPSTSGQVTIEWVEAAQEDVVITIFKSIGAIAFEKHLNKNSAGLGQLTVNTSAFGNGLYLLQFAGSKTTKTFRIMIAN